MCCRVTMSRRCDLFGTLSLQVSSHFCYFPAASVCSSVAPSSAPCCLGDLGESGAWTVLKELAMTMTE